MNVAQKHTEYWCLTIDTEASDQWPDIVHKPSWGKVTTTWIPERIIAEMTRGDKKAEIRVHCRLRLKDGSRGGRHKSFSPSRSQWDDSVDLAWAEEIVEMQRNLLSLGPGSTGCGW